MANIFMSVILLHLSVLTVSTTTLAAYSRETISIHELLKSQGLPAGLFPKNGVRSYKLDENSGLLKVYLEAPCVAEYETRVLFESMVSANLSYGGLLGVEGLSQFELFLWLPVKEIIVSDPSSGLISFDIGFAHKHMSRSRFEDPPLCSPQGGLMEKIPRKESGFGVQK